MREEDSFILREMYLGGPWEVELHHTLKFTEEGLLDKFFRLVIIGVAVDKAFVLDNIGETDSNTRVEHDIPG